MISIRKFLDGEPPAEAPAPPLNRRTSAPPQTVALDAYRAALVEIGRGSVDACPATGPALERNLLQASDALAVHASPDHITATSERVRAELQNWGRSTARHYHARAAEVKQVLLAVTQTVTSVGERDQRCATKIQSLTSDLSRIATLEDLSEMRASIQHNAAELKCSVDRLLSEGAQIVQQFQSTIAEFQTRLEQAEQTASSDTLTRLRSRLCVELQLEQRITAATPFSIALFDLDNFKHVNDTFGHIVGDELLKQFATELRSACRSSDIVGRWGGDEFIVLLDCPLEFAGPQIERVTKWVCGSYVLDGTAGPVKLAASASVGVAQFSPPESLKELLDRADRSMYQQKSTRRDPVKAS